MIKKPLLAEAIDIEDVQYPVIASPKLDGIRCLKVNGKVVSRNFKPIPNRFIRETLERILPDGADGEIMVDGTFQDCTSAVMSFDGQPDFCYNMFDYVRNSLDDPYEWRLEDMENWYFVSVLFEPPEGANETREDVKKYVKLVPNVFINNVQELKAYEQRMVSEGFEGVMVRSPEGRYKCGRSTVKERILLKIKRWKHSEFRITGFEEKMHNQNEAKVDALGHTERSTHKAGMIPAGTLGTLLGEDIHHPEWGEMRFGSGMDDAFRDLVWNKKEEFLGKICRYKYQEPGMKDKPRFPIFEGIRHPDDL